MGTENPSTPGVGPDWQIDQMKPYTAMASSREKAGGHYAVGFSLRLPAQSPVPSRLISDCNGLVNERLTSWRPVGARGAGAKHGRAPTFGVGGMDGDRAGRVIAGKRDPE
jgi:hypothetical protein